MVAKQIRCKARSKASKSNRCWSQPPFLFEDFGGRFVSAIGNCFCSKREDFHAGTLFVWQYISRPFDVKQVHTCNIYIYIYVNVVHII